MVDESGVRNNVYNVYDTLIAFIVLLIYTVTKGLVREVVFSIHYFLSVFGWTISRQVILLTGISYFSSHLHSNQPIH